MYHAGEYEKSVYYTLKSFKYGLDTTYPDKTGQMMGWNTIGMSYQQLGKYDSALIAFDKSLQIANTNHNQIWEGIGEGNKAKIFFLQKKFEEAKPLLAYDYLISKQNGIFDNAGYALQWLALINLHEGRKDSALLKAKEALELFTKQPSRQPFLNEIYNTLGEVYRSMGKLDSFYYYNQLSTHLRDSVERVMAVSQVEIVRTKLEHQQYVLKIQSFQKEKETEELKRNFIIAAIVLVAAIGLLLLNRQRLKLRHGRQLALQEKAAAEAEVAAAQEQLKMFTQNIIEKSDLIEKLEQQVTEKAYSPEQQQLIEELTHQVILTEDDWQKFKVLFEKIHSGFFLKLKERVTDITVAEQRMAALTRLHLTTKQMAALLGISPNSVNKTKQRLRQRFHLQTDSNIEEFITRL
jgi:DNA-binding CsgD family transcriptional regulator/tetratricopeptide (TPR) repeat protein